jgi:phage shock protein A
MAIVTKTTESSGASTKKLEQEIATLRHSLEALTKKCAALENQMGKINKSAAPVDTSNFVTKHEYSVFKGKVAKKVGLKR